MVGDSTLTYASYFFILPDGWMPAVDEDVLPLTHLTGLWVGRHKDGSTLLRITPHKKDKDETTADFVDAIKLNALRNPECTLDSILEYPAFSPTLRYPYKAYYFNNCPPGTYALEVFIDLPTHVIVFLLETKGDNEECIRPYLEDFKKVLRSFRWILGLSDEEIGRLLGETKD